MRCVICISIEYEKEFIEATQRGKVMGDIGLLGDNKVNEGPGGY